LISHANHPGRAIVATFAGLAIAMALAGCSWVEGQASSRGVLVVAGLMLQAVLLAVLWRVRQSQRRHRKESRRLLAIAHSLPGTVYVSRMTPEGTYSFDFLSDNVSDIFGVDRDLALRDASATRKVVLVEDLDRLREAIARSGQDLSTLEVDFRVRKPDGKIRWLRSSGIPVREPTGDVVWSGYWSDITELKANEQALREATRRLEDAQSVANIGDWTCDLATGAVTWSPQVFRMLQRDPAHGPPSLEEGVALFEDGAQATAEAFFKAQESGDPQTHELTYRLSGGDAAKLQVIVVPTLDETGAVRGMHGTIQDITSRKALEEGLSHAKETADVANRAKTVFLATMSHEIRTHLNGMLGILEVIFMTPLNPDLQGALEGVRESGRSLQQIIDDILDFSKVEAGKLDIRPEATSISELVAGVRRVHAGSASSLGLEIRHHVDPEIRPAVMVDGLRVRQILGNFVSNAIKFTPTGHVEIRALLLGREGERELVRFQVQDTGIGISPEQQQRLFQPFEQADAHTATRFGGTGLGLAISRRLAELMGGEVSMASAPGEGTIMTLDLPLAAADPALLAPARATDASPASRLAQDRKVPTTTQAASDGTLVLVVDDHPVNRMVMRSQLNVLGYAVEEVESGAEALEQWRTGRFGLVLTDCNMPFMSGYELSRHIREAEVDSGRRRTPIVACSANVISGVQQECRDAGMDGYIAKPTELVALAEIMDRWLPLKTIPSHAAAHVVADDGARAPVPVLDGPAPIAVLRGSPVDSPQVLEHFRRVNNADVVLLRQAAQGGDLDAITHLAHRIKGACGFVGAIGLATASGTLEHAGRAGATDAIEALMEEFESELERLNAYLDAQRSR
jgi:PAS domain S-box-containing protein